MHPWFLRILAVLLIVCGEDLESFFFFLFLHSIRPCSWKLNVNEWKVYLRCLAILKGVVWWAPMQRWWPWVLRHRPLSARQFTISWICLWRCCSWASTRKKEMVLRQAMLAAERKRPTFALCNREQRLDYFKHNVVREGVQGKDMPFGAFKASKECMWLLMKWKILPQNWKSLLLISFFFTPSPSKHQYF